MKLLFSFFILLVSVFVVEPAAAGTEHNLSGWAWADSVGWISFNCTNVADECTKSNYGVTMADDGALSGYAWSPNIGWINFNDLSADAGKPAAYSAPRVQGTSVTGFVKILSLGNGGWLSFKDATYNTTTRQFSGWMWNGNDDGTGIGWVELRNVMRALPPNTKPNRPMAVKPKDNIDIGTQNPAMTVNGVIFTWSNFSDPDSSDTQEAYEITITPSAGGTAFTRTVADPGSGFAYSSPALAYDTTYTWHVRVKDSHDAWSDVSEDAIFKTPKHAFPVANFSTPVSLSRAGTLIQFTDTSQVFGEGTRATVWVWDFGDGTQSNLQNPTHTYLAEGSRTTCLTTTDSDGYKDTHCSALAVTARRELPIWQRIIPF